MAAPEADFTKIYDFIYNIDSRINSLDKDSLFLEQKIENISSLRQEKYDELNADFRKLKSDISMLKDRLKNCSLEIIHLSKDMRSSIKKEQFDSIKAAADKIPFDEFIRPVDIERIMPKKGV